MNRLQTTIDSLESLLPKQSKQERFLSKVLYQKLAKGEPVSVSSIATIMRNTEAIVLELLEKLPYVEFNGSHQVVAYRGVTLKPTQHKVVVNNTAIYTWCAFDSLFLLDLLSEDASIQSSCAQCKKSIKLSSVENNPSCLSNSEVKMSFVIPLQANYESGLQSSFCCKVHFFCDEFCGNKWIENNDDIQLFSMADSLAIAEARNRYFLEG